MFADFVTSCELFDCSFSLVLSMVLSLRSCKFPPQGYIPDLTGNPAYNLSNRSYYKTETAKVETKPKAKAVSTPLTEMEF